MDEIGLHLLNFGVISRKLDLEKVGKWQIIMSRWCRRFCYLKLPFHTLNIENPNVYISRLYFKLINENNSQFDLLIFKSIRIVVQ